MQEGSCLSRQLHGLKPWAGLLSEQAYIKLFVRLTAAALSVFSGLPTCGCRDLLPAHVLRNGADSPNELGDLDPGKAYIIGGIVDRNRHKNLCAGKAREQGIATARLPVSQFFKLSAAAVLTVNQARRQLARAASGRSACGPCGQPAVWHSCMSSGAFASSCIKDVKIPAVIVLGSQGRLRV